MSDVAVIIPSIGRTQGVRRIIDAVVANDDPPDVIVVDNTADRASGLDALATAGVRVVHEPNAGAARARNRGATETDRRVLVFVDDDVRIEPTTVSELATPILTSEVDATVARVVLDPDVDIPPWLASPWLGLLSRYDRGEQVADLGPDDHGLTAAMAVDRERFREVGGLWERLGPRPGIQRTNDDVQFCRALHEAGATIRYVPTATVIHDLPPERLDRRYLFRRAFEQGRSDWVLEHGWAGRSRRDVLAHSRRAFVRDQIANVRRFREIRSLPTRLVLTAIRLGGVVAAAIREPRP